MASTKKKKKKNQIDVLRIIIQKRSRKIKRRHKP